MNLDDARQQLQQQIALSSGYSRNALRMLLSAVARSHGDAAAGQLIDEFELQRRFQISLETLLRF
jgi:hypothetical protein